MNKLSVLGILAIAVLVSLSYQQETPDEKLYYMTRADISCQVVNTQFFSSVQKICIKCPENCIRCSAETACQKCKSGYGLGTDNLCKECKIPVSRYAFGETVSYVETCSWCDKDKNTNVAYYATKCTDKAKLIGGYCYYLPNCESYTNFGTCKKCEEGYYVNEKNECQQCDPLKLPKCKACNGPNSCIKCETEYYLTTNKERLEFDTKIGDDPNYCKRCNKGCTCSSPEKRCEACLPQTSEYRYEEVSILNTKYCKKIAIDPQYPCGTYTKSLEDDDKNNCYQCPSGDTAYASVRHIGKKQYQGQDLVRCLKMRYDNKVKINEWINREDKPTDYEQQYMELQDKKIVIFGIPNVASKTENEFYQPINRLLHCNDFKTEEIIVDGDNKWKVPGSDPFDTKFWYATCGKCDNGYYEYTKTFTLIFQDTRTPTPNKFQIDKDITVCRKCSLDVEDRSGAPNKKLVRRCQKDAPLKITQCGSSEIDKYPTCYQCDADQDKENNYRGPDMKLLDPLSEIEYKLQQYLLYDNNCFQNTLSCMEYGFKDSKDLYCTACYPTYFLTKVQQCVKCSIKLNGCTECNYKDNDKAKELLCEKCVDNTYYLQDNVCKACTYVPNCVTCKLEGSKVICLSCKSNYLLKVADNTCTECEIKNVDNCLVSLSKAGDKCLKCSQCKLGYGLIMKTIDDSYFCVKCPNNCTRCDENICTQCQVGFKLDKDNVCKKDKPGCANYVKTQDGQDTYSCDFCSYGYKLNTKHITATPFCQPCMSVPTSNYFKNTYGFYDCPSGCKVRVETPTKENTNVQREPNDWPKVSSKVLKILDEEFIES